MTGSGSAAMATGLTAVAVAAAAATPAAPDVARKFLRETIGCILVFKLVWREAFSGLRHRLRRWLSPGWPQG
jgi:hypothetical protein